VSCRRQQHHSDSADVAKGDGAWESIPTDHKGDGGVVIKMMVMVWWLLTS
jgi:hypothetical protein